MYTELKRNLKQKLQPFYQKFHQAFDEEDLEKRLSTFNIQVGSYWKKDKGILFVGKATNGWKKRSISELFSEYERNEDVLSWVEKAKGENKYNTRKSAFWRVIKKLAVKNLIII